MKIELSVLWDNCADIMWVQGWEKKSNPEQQNDEQKQTWKEKTAMENKMNEAAKKTKRKSILPYRIDYTEEEIVITKKFAKEAGDMSRNAYKTMKKLREDFPTFKIVTKEIRKKENKRSYAHLTIERMEDIINEFDSDEQTGMREFERLKALYKGSNGRYAKLKAWFIRNYWDKYEKGSEWNNEQSENEEWKDE